MTPLAAHVALLVAFAVTTFGAATDRHGLWLAGVVALVAIIGHVVTQHAGEVRS